MSAAKRKLVGRPEPWAVLVIKLASVNVVACRWKLSVFPSKFAPPGALSAISCRKLPNRSTGLHVAGFWNTALAERLSAVRVPVKPDTFSQKTGLGGGDAAPPCRKRLPALSVTAKSSSLVPTCVTLTVPQLGEQTIP